MNLLFLEKHRQRTAKGTRREKASLLKRPREAAPAPLEAPRSPACAEAALPVGVRVHLLTEVLDGSPVLFRHAWVCGFICRENKTITASMMKDTHLLPPNARQPRAVTSHPEGTGPSRQTRRATPVPPGPGCRVWHATRPQPHRLLLPPCALVRAPPLRPCDGPVTRTRRASPWRPRVRFLAVTGERNTP